MGEALASEPGEATSDRPASVALGLTDAIARESRDLRRSVDATQYVSILRENLDRRADVYGVGALAYELLTGELINLDLAMLAHLGDEGWPHLRPPSERRPELPPELDAIVLRAMSFAPGPRFASCEELEQTLAQVVDRHGLAATDKAIAQWIIDELPHLPQTVASHRSAALTHAHRRLA